jgi:serine/threonine-protein kinase SRPK3
LGVPQTLDLRRAPGGANELTGPRYTVNAISMKLVDPQWLSDQIMIIDFGIAFLEDQSSNDIGTPKAYCAPELNFHSPRSRSSDIWALGCTIFEIRTGTSLFRYRGAPTRDQILISMVQVLGTLPDIWWKQWKEGRNWYDVEIKDGGELAGNIIGTLFRQIMQIGLHDGDTAAIRRKNSDFKKAPEEPRPTQQSSYDRHRESTNRLVALVEELTTSEAADVINLVNKPSSGSSQERSEEKASSGSGNKNQTGSGCGSGSSHAKSSETSIPSEGISTGKAESGTGMGTGTGTGMGTEGQVSASVALDKAAGVATEDFLELPGTIIAVAEAAGLENLLRTALAFLPEKRLPADEIATHHWFSESYESAVTN